MIGIGNFNLNSENVGESYFDLSQGYIEVANTNQVRRRNLDADGGAADGERGGRGRIGCKAGNLSHLSQIF